MLGTLDSSDRADGPQGRHEGDELEGFEETVCRAAARIRHSSARCRSVDGVDRSKCSILSGRDSELP